MQEYETAQFNILMDAIARWIRTVLTPEYMKFKERQIGAILFDSLRENQEGVAQKEDFILEEGKEGEHRFILGILNLNAAIETLSQTKLYFSRFPFRGLPISKADHCRNMCEFHFSMFYVIRCRLKEMLNEQRKTCPQSKIIINKVLKKFDATFDQDVRERNGITHHTPFSEVGLDRVTITGLVGGTGKDEDAYWKRTQTSSYRKFCKEWSARVTRRQLDMRKFMDVVFQVTLEQSDFLQ